MTRNAALTQLGRWARRTAWAVGACVILYLAAGFVGGSVPANREWRQAESGIAVYVEDNGIHTGIIVPAAAAGIDWRGLVRPEHLRDPRFAGHTHLSFGWGDRAFYIGTPTWADLDLRTVANAAIGSDRTVLHVGHLPEPVGEPGVRRVVLRPHEYRRLADAIRASFRLEGGRPVDVAFGYGRSDAFYAARGRYSAVRTCNAWTGAVLRHAGVRMGAWTPFPVGVMRWL